MPLVGAWHALVEADHDGALSGSVTIEIDDEEFAATVIPGRAGTHGGRSSARLVGGAGGLSAELEAKNYVAPLTVSQPLADILLAAGETLSSTVTTSILTHQMARWHRAKGPASRALVALCAEIGTSWRVLADGTIWVGADDWSDAELDEDSELVDEDWASGSFTLTDGAKLRPGQTYNGERIKRVDHCIEDGKFRTVARLTSGLIDRILDTVRRETDYHKLWPARVVKQNTDKSLQLYPDDARLRGQGGLDKVPIRHGLPGVSVDVVTGARVRVGFEGGDPKRPYAALWDTDLTKLDDVTITVQNDATLNTQNLTANVGTKAEILGPTVVVGGDSDYLALATKVDDELGRLAQVFTNWVVMPNDGGGALKTLLTTLLTTPPTWPQSAAASKAKGE